jgi:hypothetical protein
MPYIKIEKRPRLDPIVDLMAAVGIQADGDLNYVLFAFCRRHLTPSYSCYKNFRAELREAEAEIKRRLQDPYEDEQCKNNGDVF